MLRDRLFAVNLFGVVEECRLGRVIHPYKRRTSSIKVVEEVTQINLKNDFPSGSKENRASKKWRVVMLFF